MKNGDTKPRPRLVLIHCNGGRRQSPPAEFCAEFCDDTACIAYGYPPAMASGGRRNSRTML